VNQLTGVALLFMGGLTMSCLGSVPRTGRTEGGLYFVDEGQGPPVVLIHAFSLDRRMWDAQAARLRRDHRVIRYDLRGHGLSGPWAEPFSAIQDLLDVLDAVGIRQADLVGISAGAQVAVDFTLAHPERVSGLVLASPGLSGYRPVGSFAWMEPVTAKLQAGDPRGAAEAWAETPLMAIPGDPAADSVMRSIVTANSRAWTYDPSLQIPPDRPAAGRLAEIRVPTLILVGERDLIDTRRIADTLEAGIPRSERRTIPGVGHLLNLEAAERFTEAVLEFLGRPRAPPVRPEVGR